MIPQLVEAAVRALLVALVVWAGLRMFGIRNVMAQKAAWILVLAAAALMPVLMRWPLLPGRAALRLNVPARWFFNQPLAASMPAPTQLSSASLRKENFATVASDELAQASLAGSGGRYPAPVISHSNPAARGEESSPELPTANRGRSRLAAVLSEGGGNIRMLRPITVVAGLYFAVVSILLLRLIYGLVAAFRMWRAAEPVAAQSVLDAATGLMPGLEVRATRAVPSPVTIGSGVLLPADWASWDGQKLDIVLAHERAHVRQADFYLQLLAGVYAAVFWFSPLGWWLQRKLSDLGEAISDHAGLEEAASHTGYAQVLLEFAALPRPTAIGVAMARRSNLSHRIERLLNESSFHQAFLGSRRMLLAVMLVPVALFAGTALVRVQAASQEAPAAPAIPAAPASAPDAAAAPAAVPTLPAPPDGQDAPASPSAPATESVPAPQAAPQPPALPAAAPEPSAPGEIHDSADDRVVNMSNAQDENGDAKMTVLRSKHHSISQGPGYAYSYSPNGDSYALVTQPGKDVSFSGDWNDEVQDTLKKVSRLANGKFLWFEHDGKSYLVTDPAILAKIEAMQKPMEELGRQQEVLGKQQEVLGRQQEALGRQQEQASIPTPDLTKEMARLNAAVAQLEAKKEGRVSQEELAEVEARVGEIQGRLGALEGQVGARQGEFGRMQGDLGAQQGKLGAEQGKLGAEQGRIGAEIDRQVKSIIEQSLHNGEAKPVE